MGTYVNRQLEDEVNRGMNIMNLAFKRQKYFIRKFWGHWVVFLPNGTEVMGEFHSQAQALKWVEDRSPTW